MTIQQADIIIAQQQEIISLLRVNAAPVAAVPAVKKQSRRAAIKSTARDLIAKHTPSMIPYLKPAQQK